jgi:hypothetical protein
VQFAKSPEPPEVPVCVEPPKLPLPSLLDEHALSAAPNHVAESNPKPKK